MNNFFNTKFIQLIVIFSFLFASKLNKNDNYSNHLELFIHQDIINNFLSTIGEIDGGGKIGGFNYNWDVSNFYIVIDEEKAEFYGNITLKSGQFSREDIIVGNVNVYYDEIENLIFVKIENVDIDIDISHIFNTIPKDVVNINVDLSQYFAEPFEIQAPQPKTTSYPITMSNDTTQIVINNKETQLYLVENGIKIISIYQCEKQ
ncbi:MAG: hypothetical protein CBE33_02825 [Candidatus Pelagibacter sp. TMED273]|nr:MAG: hypothetical protein CBE33_02825 [Candidatus Pelagibacter sp. TMED273]